MTFHKWVMKAWPGSHSASQVAKDVAREGNELFKGGDEHGKEWKPVKRRAYWEDPANVETES